VTANVQPAGPSTSDWARLILRCGTCRSVVGEGRFTREDITEAVAAGLVSMQDIRRLGETTSPGEPQFLWMGQMRARFASPQAANLARINHAGRAVPIAAEPSSIPWPAALAVVTDPCVVVYPFPFTTEPVVANESPTGPSSAYGTPSCLSFPCVKCALAGEDRVTHGTAGDPLLLSEPVQSLYRQIGAYKKRNLVVDPAVIRKTTASASPELAWLIETVYGSDT
jgi:hypothetical protein